MINSFDSLTINDRRATMSAMSLVSVLLILCCISKWILYIFTIGFTVYALILVYKEFFEKKKNEVKKDTKLKRC